MSKVFMVGSGPGDPELLTRKAIRVLRTAEVVLYDRLCGEAVLELIPRSARKIYVGKHEGQQQCAQERILRLLLHYAHLGKRVVRLKGGDPFVFGRGGEEWGFLRANGIEVEVVPGVSSAIAAPELAGIPLTYRGVAASFAVVAGHCGNGRRQNWERYAAVDTLVILMGVKHRVSIAASLIEAGREPSQPVAFIENATTTLERVITATLQEVAAGAVKVTAPAVFVVGEVVRLRAALCGAGASLAAPSAWCAA